MFKTQQHQKMKKVKTHRYALAKGSILYDSVEGAEVCVLEGGSWIGVVSKSGDWFQVNTALHDGWVKIEDTVNAKPYTLSAKVSAKVSGLIQNYILL